MRTFIALEIPELIKKEIGQIQKQLSRLDLSFRFVKPENCHLTLAFLGSIAPAQTITSAKIVNQINCHAKPIKLSLGELKAFPNFNRPRVIFISLAGETDKLKDLADQVRRELKKESLWFDEKPFTPHLTLGRVKTRPASALFLAKARVKPLSFSAEKVTLFQSQLTTSGPTYTKIVSKMIK